MNDILLCGEDPLLVSKLAEALNEKEIDLIHTILDVMGTEFVLTIFEKAKSVIKEGGLEKKNGGKRSPGGTFFQLVKETASSDQAKEIFRLQAAERKKRYRIRKRLMLKLKKLDLSI